jgi:uncharacterized protein YoxC
VLDRVECVADAGAEFQRIATMLRALATSLRVEDGRKADGFGFDSVSFDVVRLGGLIASKFDAIMKQASQLQDTATSARKRGKDFLQRQGTSAAVLLAEARAGLSQMAELNAAGAAVRRDAEQASGAIGANVTRILVALQVHDITRQMIEHVVEAVQAFVAEGKDDAASAAMTDQEFQADLSALCRVQSLQVRKAREELVEAESGIAETLRAMSGQVEAIVERTRRLTADDNQSGSLLARVERNVGQVAEALRQHLKHEKQTFAAVESVAVATAAMECFVGQIAIIANDVKVVALNALVKAVKTGSTGAVFAILAQAIKDLSIEVASKTQHIGQAMRDMAQTARELGAKAQNQSDADSTEGQLFLLVADLRRYHTSLLSCLVALRRGSAVIAVEVEEIARGLVQQVQAADELEAVEQELAAMADEAALLAGPLARERLAHWGDADSDRYTMESERIVHRSVAQPPTSLGPIAACAPASDLGSNVELF